MPHISILSLPVSPLPSPSSSKGNSSSPTRSFPVVGSLGLSPVVLEGVVHIRLASLERALLASSVEVRVRCVESKLSGAGVVGEEVLWSSTQVVWKARGSAPPREDGLVQRLAEQLFGDWEGKFKIVVPIEEGKKLGRSSVSLKEYRVVWQVQVGESLVSLVSQPSPFMMSLACFGILKPSEPILTYTIASCSHPPPDYFESPRQAVQDNGDPPPPQFPSSSPDRRLLATRRVLILPHRHSLQHHPLRHRLPSPRRLRSRRDYTPLHSRPPPL